MNDVTVLGFKINQ